MRGNQTGHREGISLEVGRADETRRSRHRDMHTSPGPFMRIYTFQYEWDEAKNLRNQREHGGVSFELAALAIEDEFCPIIADRIDPVTGSSRVPGGT